MTEREVPKLDPRRADDFRAELTERARAWIRNWNVGDEAGGFGAALLDTAARFSAQVAERLDRAGEKLSLGLLDWLALRGKAARPARVPVAFKLADNATNAVLAPQPVRLQADVGGASVVFETESDVNLVPGSIELLIGIDAPEDRYFLPPAGLSTLEPLEPLPTQWHTKAFAQSGATHIQLDPPLGLVPDMLLDMAGRQYRVDAVDGDLVKLDPAVDAAGGITANTEVDKVVSFDPFGTVARNQQRHYVYLGDDDLFNIDAAAVFEVHGADTHLSAAKWEYFGKSEVEDTAQWRTLDFGPDDTQGAGKVTLLKPKGSVEPTQVGNKARATRWIRAGQEKVESATDILSTEALTVLVNPGASTLPCPASGIEVKPGAESTADGFSNTTPLAFTSAFYPLGREPKQFDTFYLGSSDVFSKKGAAVAICFEMSDPAANAFSAMREGLFANRLLASVGGDGALHLLQVDGTTGALSRFLKHEPLQPRSDSGAALTLDAEASYRPPMWALNDDNSVPNATSGNSPFGSGSLGILGIFLGNPFYVAASAGISVWVWKEYPSFVPFSKWIFFGNVPAPAGVDKIDGLVYLRDGDDGTNALLFAACGGMLFKHSALAGRAGEAWKSVTLGNVPVSVVPGDPYKLTALAPIDKMPKPGRWHGSIADGMVGIFTNRTRSLVYFVQSNGTCTALDDTLPAAKGTQPAAAHIGAEFYVYWQLVSPAPVAPATTPSVFLHVAKVAADRTTHNGNDDTVPGADGPVAVTGGLLEIPPSDAESSVIATGSRDNDSWILNWTPFGGASPKYFETKLPDGVGPLGGAPTLLDRFIVVPGTQSDAWSASWDASLRHDFHVTLESGVVVPTTLTPAILRHDYVAIETTGSTIEQSEVTALDYTLGTDRFHSLQDELGIGSANSQLVLYRHASAVGLAGVFVAGNKMTRDPTDLDTQRYDWLLVTGTGYSRFRRVLQINAGSEIQFYAVGPALPNVALTYWRPERIPGRAAPFMRLDPNLPEGAWEARLLEQVRLNFTQRSPGAQSARAFAVTPAGRPMVVVLDTAWDAATPQGNGGSECSFDATFGLWARQLSENTADAKLIWEFWSGRGWDELVIDKDDTQYFKVTGKLEFEVPATLAPTEVSGKINHWIRARLIEGDYGHDVVTVLTKPHPTIADATVQEVQHDRSEFHPPLVVNMRMRYSVSAALPAYLLTQNGGSLRDQSDANRTPGTFVEAFVPLAVQLGRLEHNAALSTALAPCAPPCECEGKSAAAAQADTTAPPAAGIAVTSVPQSIMLGFSAGLIGEPINVLLLVEERAHDDFAPLKVEALVNDRFEPLAVRDTTRALGESGLLSMAFPVKPSPRELFGRSLTWLRLSPSRASVGATWKPVIRGAYLNATWATAAETLTREPLGSSDGRPHLRVQVARPPLLQDSLELRVREPLDDDERRLLLAQDASSVKSTEPDLPGDWVLWKQVADPGDAAPRDRVYSLDEQSGEVQFGDGMHGMIPPIGRDAVVAFSYRRIEPAADGSDSVPANSVVARTALQLVTPLESVEASFAADHAAGGSPPEADARVLRFGNARLRHRERAIAPTDFEDLALQSSPDVAQARAVRTVQGLKLVVVMRGPQPAPDAAQRRELKRLLQGAATPLLGDRDALTIVAPKVRRLRLHLALLVASLEDAGRLGEAAKGKLASLFDTATGGVSGSGWPLGAAPADDDIAYALDGIAELAGIDSIKLVEVDATGNELPWQTQVRADELVMLAEDALRIRFEPLELPV